MAFLKKGITDNIACMLQYVINLEVNESIATMV